MTIEQLPASATFAVQADGAPWRTAQADAAGTLTLTWTGGLKSSGSQFVLGRVCARTGGPGCNPGDLDGDGFVNVKDLALVAGHSGQTPASAGWDPAADPNGDGVVDLRDLTIVTDGFGQTYP
jgi:hypothetical protein